MKCDWQPITEAPPPRSFLLVYVPRQECPFIYTLADMLDQLVSEFPAATHYQVVALAPPLDQTIAMSIAPQICAVDEIEKSALTDWLENGGESMPLGSTP